MKNLLRVLALGLAALYSCSQDYIDAPVSPDTQDRITMTFQLKDDSGSVSYATPGDFDEDAFRDDLWMLAFTNVSGTLRYYGGYKVEVLDGGYPNGRITIPRGLLAVSFRMLFVANGSAVWADAGSPDDAFLASTAPRIGMDIDEVRNELELAVPSEGWRKGRTRLPMYSILDHEVASSPLPEGTATYNYKNTVVLLRSMARLDVLAQKQSPDNPDTMVPLENFKIANVYVFNTSDHVWIPFDPDHVNYNPSAVGSAKYEVSAPSFPDDTPYSTIFGQTPDYVTAVDQPVTPGPGSPEKLYSDLSGLLYLPETPNTGVTGNEHLTRPYIIIKGYYGAEAIAKAEAGDTDVRESYYRLEIADGQDASGQPNYLNLKRSDRIILTINDVKSAGFDNIEDAKKKAGLNIDVSVNVFSQIPSNVVFNGQSYLAAERMSVTMPRKKGASYKMAVSNSDDIPWDIWELGAKSAADDSFLDKSEASIILPSGATEADGYFKVVKSKNALTISTLQDWSADVADSLLVRAANLTLRMRLAQEDIDMLDWEYGGEEDGEIVSDNELSTSSLYFPALGSSQRIRNYSTKRDIATIEVYDTDGTANPGWLAYSLDEKGKTVTISTSPNGFDDERTARMMITLTGSNVGNKQYEVTLTQSALPTDNVLAASLGLKVRDRNVGADGASYEYAATGTAYTKAQFNDNLCPEGWFTPEIEDIQAYFRHPDISLLSITEEDGKDYVLTMGKNSRAYMGMLDKSNANNNPWFWTYLNGSPVLYSYEYVADPGSDPDVVHNMRLRINTSPGDNTEGYVRCVKAFKVASPTVEINMIGEEGYIEFDPLNSTDGVKTIKQQNDSRFKIERDGLLNRFRVTSQQTNWSTSPVSETVVFAMDDGSTRTQEVTVTQAARLPLAGKDETITIDGIEWQSVNAGVGVSPSEAMAIVVPYRFYAADPGAMSGNAQYTKTYYVEGETANNAQITYYPASKLAWISLEDTGLAVSNMQDVAETASGDLGTGRNTELSSKNPFAGTVYFPESAPTNYCPSGWRPANITEWSALAERLRVSEVELPGNPGQKVLLYYATDGEKLIFFPTGPAGRYREVDWWGQAYGTSTPYVINGVENNEWTYMLFFETSPDHVAAGKSSLGSVASPNDSGFDLLTWSAISDSYMSPENGSLLPSYLMISTANLSYNTSRCFYTRCVRGGEN